ncbi:MAG: hypothetical protein GOV15_02650 [Candidatus Diapherotrites archaeon]|nr:hypothetical protein [Candidatus Diapherotrites archaeon]
MDEFSGEGFDSAGFNESKQLDKQSGQFQQRRPSIEKSLGEINNNDKRLALIGTVARVDSDNAEAKIEDESGSALLLFTDLEVLKKVQEGCLARIIGKPYSSDKGKVIRVEIAQDVTGLDMDIYKKVKSLESMG